MAIYEYKVEDDGNGPDKNLYIRERNIYGSSRVGIENVNEIIASSDATNVNIDTDVERKVGDKQFELSNHLGNVLEVISDHKISVETSPGLGLLSHYGPEVLAQNDYYPFGMLLPNRHEDGDEYRYGFQGQEKDDEVYGSEGTSVNYKYRMYNARVGKFLSIDPLEKKYPYWSPYAFSGNQVIHTVEIEGLEAENNLNYGEAYSWSLFEDELYDATSPIIGPLEETAENFFYTPERNEDGFPVIDNTSTAITHYYRGGGETVELGYNTKMAMQTNSDVKNYQERIESGATSNPAEGSGLAVDMTSDTYHLGKMTLSYTTTCDENQCTTTYTVDDQGFVDANEIMGNWLGDGDGYGPEAELGGTPYDYNAVIWSVTYTNPGYKYDENGVPLPLDANGGSGSSWGTSGSGSSWGGDNYGGGTTSGSSTGTTWTSGSTSTSNSSSSSSNSGGGSLAGASSGAGNSNSSSGSSSGGSTGGSGSSWQQ